MVPRRPKTAPRALQEASQDPKGLKSTSAVSHFRLSGAPRRLKKLPRPPQDSPRRLEHSIFVAREAARRTQEAAKKPREAPRGAQDAPKRPQRGP
eukprot:8430078-Pyramimonas_sp.AAC.1